MRARGGGERFLLPHRRGPLEQPQRELDPQNAPHGIVYAFHRDFAALNPCPQVTQEGQVVGRHHHHIHPGVDGGDDGAVQVARVNLVHRLPVGDDEAAKAQFALQDIGQQVAVGVHFDTIPRTVGGHHHQRARLHGGAVGRQEQFPHGGFVHLHIALVERVAGGLTCSSRAAIAE